MKTPGIVVLVFAVLVGGEVRAQNAGVISVYSDPGGFDCILWDDTPGEKQVYIVHTLIPCAMGSRFKVVQSPGVTLTYVSEQIHVGYSVGNTQTGISLCYAPLTETPLLLATLTYTGPGTSVAGSEIKVVDHPESGTIEVIDCFGGSGAAEGGNLILNCSIFDCSCSITSYGLPQTPFDFCQPVSTEATTWGAVKALYQ